jgi:HD-like signal output (HDOD) protein
VSESRSLLDRIKHLIDSGRVALPVFDQVSLKLQRMKADETLDAEAVEKLIVADQVLVAEVLRAANSPFYGGLTQIQTVKSAVVRLGMKQVYHLALLASQRSKYNAKDPELRVHLQALWDHASATAMGANWIVRKLGFKKVEDEAFLGGLLHDVGQLVILRAIDEIKATDKTYFDFSAQLTDEVLKTAHAELGCDLLKRWDVPELYYEIARVHHLPDFDTANIALAAVRLANYAAAKVGISPEPDPSLVLSSLPEAHCLGAGEIQLAQLELMLEDSFARAIASNA